MKKICKLITATLIISTTAFVSFACKNKTDTTKTVDNETAFEAYASQE